MLFIAAFILSYTQIITTMWKYYALLSAFFAALTAVFAKIGVKDVDSDLATAIRTTVILFITWGIAILGNHTCDFRCIPSRTWIFLILSGAATGLSWLFLFQSLATGRRITCCPHRQTQCGIHHLPVVHVLERTDKRQSHRGCLADNCWQYRYALQIIK